MQSVLVAANQ